jgi:hypothetical protein
MEKALQIAIHRSREPHAQQFNYSRSAVLSAHGA